MRISNTYTKPDENLLVKIDKKNLDLLLTKSKNNFFNYLYHHSDYIFYKSTRVRHFGLFCTKSSEKMTKEEALPMYKEVGFKNVLNLLEQPSFKNIFRNYNILLNIDVRDKVYVLLKDLKLLLDMSEVTPEEIKINRYQTEL